MKLLLLTLAGLLLLFSAAPVFAAERCEPSRITMESCASFKCSNGESRKWRYPPGVYVCPEAEAREIRLRGQRRQEAQDYCSFYLTGKDAEKYPILMQDRYNDCVSLFSKP